MDYLPTDFRNLSIVPGAVEALLGANELTLVRHARVVGRGSERDGRIPLRIEGLPQPVPVQASLNMRFGTESVTAALYLDWVIEAMDQVDFLIDANGMRIFWIHIRYRDVRGSDLRFSTKDDGLFAMRTKAGEKAQRLVARTLCEGFRHSYPSSQILSPGYFEITYEGKKERQADLVCERCNLKVEVKKRNRDRRFRISHSANRPFSKENSDADWHAIVFPDRSIHWLSNATIAGVLAQKIFHSGSDQYDAWADLPADTPEIPPPLCPNPLPQ